MNNEHLYNYIQKIKLSNVMDIQDSVINIQDELLGLHTRIESLEIMVGFLAVLVLVQFIYSIFKKK